MEAEGDEVVPTKSTVSLEENCGVLWIQVMGDIPKLIRTHNYEGLGSWRLYMRVQTLTPSSVQIDSSDIAGTLTVSKHLSIQSVLECSPAWTTIQIPAGKYFESLNITKPVVLIGRNGSRLTKLFGKIFIASDNVTIDGLSIYPLDRSTSTIKVMSSNSVMISACQIARESNTKFDVAVKSVSAIHVINSTNVFIINNVLSNLGVGIDLKNCTSCTVQSNLFKSCWNAIQIIKCDSLRLVRNYFKENVLVLSDKGEEHVAFAGKNLFEKNLDSVGTLTKVDSTIVRGVIYPLSPNSEKETVLMTQPVKRKARIIVTGSCSGKESGSEICAFLQGLWYMHMYDIKNPHHNNVYLAWLQIFMI